MIALYLILPACHEVHVHGPSIKNSLAWSLQCAGDTMCLYVKHTCAQVSPGCRWAETRGGQDEIRPGASVDCSAPIHNAPASYPTTQNTGNSPRRYVMLLSLLTCIACHYNMCKMSTIFAFWIILVSTDFSGFVCEIWRKFDASSLQICPLHRTASHCTENSHCTLGNPTESAGFTEADHLHLCYCSWGE